MMSAIVAVSRLEAGEAHFRKVAVSVAVNQPERLGEGGSGGGGVGAGHLEAPGGLLDYGYSIAGKSKMSSDFKNIFQNIFWNLDVTHQKRKTRG